MTKSATEVMRDIIISSVIEAVTALRTDSNGAPNILLRDINSLHPNTTYDDMPETVRNAIALSAKQAFLRLKREGYVLTSDEPVFKTKIPMRPKGRATTR